MAGFGDVSLVITSTGTGDNSTSTIVSGTVSSFSGVLAGDWIVLFAGVRNSSGDAVECVGNFVGAGSGPPDLGTPVRWVRHMAVLQGSSHAVEIWGIPTVGDAGSNSWSLSGSLTGTADRRESRAYVFRGFPEIFDVLTATFERSGSGTTHPCGTLDVLADDLLLTMGMASGTLSTRTSADGYIGAGPSGSSFAQRRTEIESASRDAAWQSVTARGVVCCHIAFREPSGGTDSVVPVSDVSAGGWTPSAGTDLFAMVNDDSDATYIRSGATAGPDTAVLQLGPMTDPGAQTVRLRVRHRKTP